MQILLSAEYHSGFGGTETYTQTVAQELLRLGHHASIFTPNAGAMAELARKKGIPVLSRDDLPARCDAVIAQDAPTCQELAGRFPQAARVMVVHSRDHVLQEPPQLPGVCHGLVVMNDRVGRWVRGRAWHPPITRLRQPIAVANYSDLPPPRPNPRFVLVTSNYVSGPRGRLIDEACRRAGLETIWIGATSRPSASPERALAQADIVLGLGRSVLEGMAAGRAAFVYGVGGAGGWVTGWSYPRIESDGFAGLTDPRPTTVERMAGELRKWRADMGEANRDLVSVNHNVRPHAIELVELLRSFVCGPQSSEPVSMDERMPSAAEEIARLLRVEWQTYERAMHAVVIAREIPTEHKKRKARVEELDGEMQSARACISKLEEQLLEMGDQIAEQDIQMQSFRATRRYRLARLMARPLDQLRTSLKARPL